MVSWANRENVALFALSFHVDYWNYLGWKDPYSHATYSARQYQYADWLRSRVYTPQLVLNGQREMIGSRREEVRGAVEDLLNQPSAYGISAQLDDGAEGELVVSYSLAGDPAGARIEAALVEKSVHTAVMRGENRGRELEHVGVVRSFTGQEANTTKGRLQLEVPEDLKTDANKWEVIVFLQDTQSGKVLAATQTAAN